MSTLLRETRPEPHDDSAGKDQQVRAMFNRIARTYDLLNDCISFGMHRLWKRRACRLLALSPGDRVLDVCTGTGDLTGYLLKHVETAGEVVGLDFSEDMLAIGQKRFGHHDNVRFVPGDAMALPFEDGCFDGAIVAFGLRNVTDIQRAVDEMARVVKPGGWIINLDTNPKPNIPGFWLYFSVIMPLIGRLFSMDASAYHYLSRSTRNFLPPEALKQVFERAGLTQVESRGWMLGMASMQRGRKPSES